jgi:hypothetical protein
LRSFFIDDFWEGVLGLDDEAWVNEEFLIYEDFCRL